MIVHPSCRNEAALALCPHSLAKGLDELDALIANALSKIRPVKRTFEIALLCAAAVAIGTGHVLYVTDLELQPVARPWFEYISALCAFGGGIVGWQKLQHSQLGLKLFDPSQSVPPALQTLISEYASGERSARTVSETTPRELFRSHWSVLLFSADAEVRGWVRSATGKREARETYPSGSIEIAKPEPENEQRTPASMNQERCALPTSEGQSTRWEQPGWLMNSKCQILIADILTGATGATHFRLQNVLPFMAEFLASSRRLKNHRAACIRAARKEFGSSRGYADVTLGQIYDGTYKPVFKILASGGAERSTIIV